MHTTCGGVRDTKYLMKVMMNVRFFYRTFECVCEKGGSSCVDKLEVNVFDDKTKKVVDNDNRVMLRSTREL